MWLCDYVVGGISCAACAGRIEKAVGRRRARRRADATRARARLVSTASDVGCQRARPRAGASQGPPARRPLGRPAARRPRARRGQPPVGREPGPSVEAAGATAFTCQSGWQRMTIRQSNRPSVTRPDHPSPGRTIRHPAGPSVTRRRPDHPSLGRTIRHPAGPSVTRPDHPSPGRTVHHPAGPSVTRLAMALWREPPSLASTRPAMGRRGQGGHYNQLCDTDKLISGVKGPEFDSRNPP